MIGFKIVTLTPRQLAIIDVIGSSLRPSITDIQQSLSETVSTPTLNRELARLVALDAIVRHGKGRATYYSLSSTYTLFRPVDLEAYFSTDVDERQGRTGFNRDVLPLLGTASCFTLDELTTLEVLSQQYKSNIQGYPKALFQKEMERLTIELSWKSSQIEGNTYSLLDTERLFLEKEKAPNKPESDATMLLNHKRAFRYLLEHRDKPLTLNVRFVEELHTLLVDDLDVGRNLRSRTVGITGTAYKPLDNVYQLRESLERSCQMINSKENPFEKALLAVVLTSYLQPFEDGNKRTGRMLGNALLVSGGLCPLSYRSVDSLVYKKAMLLFYEQNNLSAFKRLFMEQIAFSVNTYFQ